MDIRLADIFDGPTKAPEFTGTDYDPISDTLSCGCDPNWPDHRCRYGCSRCGAPDDCYCPSPSETWENQFDGTIFPATLTIDAHHDGRRLSTVTVMTYKLDDLVWILITTDNDTCNYTLIDATLETTRF